MVRWLVTYLALTGPWLPDRVGAPRDAFVVLALPCCTETERGFLSFLALVPSSGLGCGDVGLIVSSWLTLSREVWASAARQAAGDARLGKAAGRLMGGLMRVSVCAGLGGVLKGAQIGSCGLGGELSGDSGGLRSVRRRMYAGRADRGPPDGSE